MRSSGLQRYAPLTGIAFFAFLLASFIVGGDTPDVDDSTEDVVAFWADNDSASIASAVLGAYAVVFYLWFAGSLRSAINVAEGAPGRLASIAFGGAVVYATGGAIVSAFQLALGDIAGDVPDEVVQTLSVIYADFFFPFAIGNAIVTMATGLASLRYGLLPRWLGWVSILIAVVSVTPIGFVGFLAGVIWVIVVSVILFRRETAVAAATA